MRIRIVAMALLMLSCAALAQQPPTTAPSDQQEYAAFGLRLENVPSPPWQRISGGTQNIVARWEKRDEQGGRPPMSMYIAMEKTKRRTLDSAADDIAAATGSKRAGGEMTGPGGSRAIKLISRIGAMHPREQIL